MILRLLWNVHFLSGNTRCLKNLLYYIFVWPLSPSVTVIFLLFNFLFTSYQSSAVSMHCVNIGIGIHVCICVNIWLCVLLFAHMYVHRYFGMCNVCMSVCAHICMCICACECVLIYIHVCVCMYIFLCTHACLCVCACVYMCMLGFNAIFHLSSVSCVK